MTTIFSRAMCAPCKTVKSILERKNIPYQIKDIEDELNFKEMLNYSNGATHVPVVVTDKGTMIGFNPSRLMEIL